MANVHAASVLMKSLMNPRVVVGLVSSRMEDDVRAATIVLRVWTLSPEEGAQVCRGQCQKL